MDHVIWITWEQHRRTTVLAEHFGMKLYTLVCNGSRLMRYAVLGLRTFRLLLRERPKCLVVQNPSIVLAFIAWLLRPLLGYALVVDAHNVAIEPYANAPWVVRWVTQRLLRAADLTIVTNRFLAEKVVAAGGTPAVLPDKLPTTSPGTAFASDAEFLAVLIATYAADEPVAEIIDAFRVLPPQWQLLVTGNWRKHESKLPKPIPANVGFTGFLEEDRYWGLLERCDAVIDLSLKDDCLVCGAYESVAVSKPLILSDDRAIRDYFSKGTKYARPMAAHIAACVREMHATLPQMRKEVGELKDDLGARWLLHADRLALALRRFAS